ncbi:MAG: RidA family protein [Alphaproteobacteria bacterium]|nr:RidA family protein [Alphaproteobacteria bacterium]
MAKARKKTTRKAKAPAKRAAAPAARAASKALAKPLREGIIIEPVHPGKPLPIHNMPFVPAFSVQGGRTLWLSGMGPVPIYHKHPHDPIEEAKWYEGDFRDQCWKTFKNIERILNAGGADMTNVIKITEYLVNVMRDQDVLNEITWEIWGKEFMPPRTLIEIPSLAHKDMLLEIDVIAQIPG